MKTAASLFATALLFSILSASAGGFGGPGPFRNGSPLPTGTDGTYNASMRGNNLSGVFRFTIARGSQSDSSAGTSFTGNVTRSNSWIAFYKGNVVRGLTDASIADGSVSGVLDPFAPIAGQQISAAVAASDLTGGWFTGTAKMNSPTGEMKGTGSFTVLDDNQTITNNSTSTQSSNSTTNSTGSTSTSTSTGTNDSIQNNSNMNQVIVTPLPGGSQTVSNNSTNNSGFSNSGNSTASTGTSTNTGNSQSSANQQAQNTTTNDSIRTLNFRWRGVRVSQ